MVHALLVYERVAADRATEVELVEPPVEAVLVEEVAAVEHADAVAVFHGGQADDAVGDGAVAVAAVVVAVGEEAVEVELLGEDGEAGES